MSLGDHLEELRARLILGMVGLFLGMIVCLFFGKALIGVMSRPFEGQIEKLRKANKVLVLDDEPVKTSEYVQAVLVTHSDEDGYRTYTSHISIADLLSRLEKVPVEGPAADTPAKSDEAKPSEVKAGEVKPGEAKTGEVKPGEAKPKEANAKEAEPGKGAEKESDALPVRQAAVIAHHPDTGFVVYATAQQVGEVLEQLTKSGALVESGPGQSNRPTMAVIVTQKPTEGFMVYMKTSMLFGILLTSPWLIWQIWAFVSAGLYKREKRYVHTVAPISGALFITGGMFFMLCVAPMMMGFLIRFDAAMGMQSFWSLEKYINMVFTMTLVFGAMFQMPIALVFAERLGLISIEAMTKNRKFVILGIVFVAAIATPSPDVVSQIALAIPLYGLYEASIFYCRIRQSRSQKAAAGAPT